MTNKNVNVENYWDGCKDYSSEKDWKEKSRKNFLNDISAVMKKNNAEISAAVVRGDASVTVEATLQEYCTINGDPRYLYQTIDIGSWHNGDED